MYIPTLERLFELGEDDKIKNELTRELPDDPLIDTLDAALGVVRGNMSPLPAFADSDHDDAAFVRQLWSIPAQLDPDGTLRRDSSFPATRVAGVSYDFIDKTCEQPWSIAKLLNFLALCRIKPTRRAAVVATMRNDGISMLEFVAHYRAIGFEHIYIFSNDNADGSSELLELLAAHGVITYIDNSISQDTSPQRKAFEYSVHFLVDLRDYEWVFFADSDELLVPAPQYRFNIQSVIGAVAEAHPVERPSAVCYCWKWYGGHTFQRTPGLQLEKFCYSRMNSTVKSLARLSDVRSMRPLHYPICKRKSFFVNSAFDRVETSLISKAPVSTAGGWVNHYWNRSFEEYAVKRWRGDSLDMITRVNDYKRSDEQYFGWNVPASKENYDPTPMDLIDAVHRSIIELRRLGNIDEIETRISDRFEEFLFSLIDKAELYARFSNLAPRYSWIKF